MIKPALSFAMLAALFCLIPNVGFSGMEIGNAHFTELNNKTGKFKIEYPDNWAVVDHGLAASLTERVIVKANTPDSAITPNGVMLNSISLTEIHSNADLLDYLTKTYPERTWVTKTIGGRSAFESTDTPSGASGVIYVLKADRDVLSMFYKMREEKILLEQLSHIRDTLKFYP